MVYGSGARREGEEESAEERGEQGEEGGSGKASDGGCTATRRCPAVQMLPCSALHTSFRKFVVSFDAYGEQVGEQGIGADFDSAAAMNAMRADGLLDTAGRATLCHPQAYQGCKYEALSFATFFRDVSHATGDLGSGFFGTDGDTQTMHCFPCMNEPGFVGAIGARQHSCFTCERLSATLGGNPTGETQAHLQRTNSFTRAGVGASHPSRYNRGGC